MTSRQLSVAVFVGWAGLLVISAGCASGSPPERAAAAATSTLADAVEQGTDAAEQQDDFEIRTRYNPCRCPAPDFEARLRDRWRRIVVTGDEPLVEELTQRARTQEASPGMTFFWLEGEFAGEEQFEQTGVEYERFELRDFRHERYDEASR